MQSSEASGCKRKNSDADAQEPLSKRQLRRMRRKKNIMKGLHLEQSAVAPYRLPRRVTEMGVEYLVATQDNEKLTSRKVKLAPLEERSDLRPALASQGWHQTRLGTLQLARVHLAWEVADFDEIETKTPLFSLRNGDTRSLMAAYYSKVPHPKKKKAAKVNDYIIDAYGMLLANKRNFVFSTLFANKLLRSQDHFKWTDVLKADRTRVDNVCVPMYVKSHDHWILMVAFLRQKLMLTFDNLLRDELRELHLSNMHKLSKYLDATEWPRAPPNTEWRLEVRQEGNPQLDGTSCGVWLLANMRNVIRSVAAPFSQRDIPNLRQLFTYELLNFALLAPISDLEID